MATFQLRRFSNPLTLRAIRPERLLAFLDPFREFFVTRGYPLPPASPAPEIDYQRLVNIFMSPDRSTPRELLDALFLVDEMSTKEDMDILLDAVSAAELDLDPGPDHSPADVAVQVWLRDSDILERKHAQRFLFKPRSFEYFQTQSAEPPVFATPSQGSRRKLEKDLDDWFEKKKRGRNSRVFIYERDDEVAFLVRHGEPFKREESQEGAEVASVCYRPVKYDVILYNREIGELRINAQLVGEKKLYRQQFGKHFFAGEDCFPGTKKYTLEPLRLYGPASLSCIDIDGIDWIKLKETEIFYPGNPWETVVRKSEDVFAALEARGREFPAGGRIIRASFVVKFSNGKTPRSVVIRPSNIAQYTRDDDSVFVEAWLNERGFIVTERPEGSKLAVPAMADA